MRSWAALILVLGLANSGWLFAQDTDVQANQMVPATAMRVIKSDGQEMLIQSAAIEVDSEKARTELAELIDFHGKNPNNIVAVSTDLAEMAEVIQSRINQDNLIAYQLPAEDRSEIESIVNKNETKKSGGYLSFAANSIRNDKIGFLVTTIITGTDIFIWLHATKYTWTTRISESLLSIALGATFGIKKGLWNAIASKISEKLQNTVGDKAGRFFFGKKFSAEKSAAVCRIVADYLVMLPIQMIRIFAIVGGGSASVFMSGHADYTLSALIGKSVGIAALLSLAYSFTSDGWHRWIAKMEQYSRENPNDMRAKVIGTLARRLHEARNITVNGHTSNVGLMAFSISSWSWVIANGVVGRIAAKYFDFTKEILGKSYDATVRVYDVILDNQSKEWGAPYSKATGGVRCEMLFGI